MYLVVLAAVLMFLPSELFADHQPYHRKVKNESRLMLRVDQVVDLVKGALDLKSLELKEKAIENEGERKSSWGDPEVRLGANNLPAETLSPAQTPMSNYSIELSQKIPLSFKYSNLGDSYSQKAVATRELRKDKERAKIAQLIGLFIEKKRVRKDIEIHETNIRWLENIIKISNKLYSNGKISQQALLSLKIRLSKIHSHHTKHYIMLDKIDNLARETLNLKESKPISLSSRGLDSLKLDSKVSSIKKIKSPKLKAYRAELKSSQAFKDHSTSNFIPDMKIGAKYHFRENIDGHGDFVSGFVAFEIPIGSSKYAQNREATAKVMMAEHNYTSYKRKLQDHLAVIKNEIHSLSEELRIIQSKSIKLAKLSREGAVKNYSLGNADYKDLLEAEVEYQSLLARVNRIEADIMKLKIEYIYKSGGSFI